jgi:hypothetical protein
VKKLASEQREVVTSLDRKGHVKVYALAGTGKALMSRQAVSRG